MGHGCFSNTGITGSLVIPEGVKNIYGAAFSCSQITSLTLPDSLEYIDGFAFEHCTSLSSVVIPKNVANIVWNPFIAAGTLTGIGCSDENTTFTSVDGVLYTNSKDVLYICPAGKSGEFTVPEGVKRIHAFAFFGADKITKLELCDGLESIDINAFAGCSFTSVRVPNSVTFIGWNSLGYNSSGEKIDGFTIIGGAVALDDLPPDFDVNRAIFIGNAYYDSESRTICTDSDYISYYYDIGNNNTVQFTITDKSAPVTVTKNDGISIYNMSEPITLYKGQNIYISVPLNDFVGHRLLVNGNKTELTINGDGILWGTNILVESDTLTLELEEAEWTEEQLAELVTIKCSDDVELHPYNSFLGSVISSYTVKNGEYFSRSHKLVLMSEKTDGITKKFLINNQVVTPELSDGKYTAFYNIPTDVTELDISVVYEAESGSVYFGSNECLNWTPVDSAEGYIISVSIDDEYAYSLDASWALSDYFLEHSGITTTLKMSLFPKELRRYKANPS